MSAVYRDPDLFPPAATPEQIAATPLFTLNARRCDRCRVEIAVGYLCRRCSRVETTPDELERMVAR